MPNYILDIPDDYTNNCFGVFTDIESAEKFLIKHYPRPIENLVLRESRANPRNLLTIYFSNVMKNKYYKGDNEKGYNPEFIRRDIATLHEVSMDPCLMIMRDGH